MSTLHPETQGAAPRRRTPHWSAIGEATCVWGIWLLYGLYRAFGRLLFRVVMYPVVVYFWLAYPLARRSSMEYLARVEAATGAIGTQPTWRQSLRHLFSFGDTMLDKLLAIGGRYRFEHVSKEGGDVLLRQIASGRGGIIMTAHVGCLELCRAMANRLNGLRLTVLVHSAHAERFNRILARLDPDSMLQLYQIDDISPATALELSARVEAGEFVAIAGDRAPAHGGRAVRVPFLGQPARFPVGPYVLASLLKCPLYAMGCVREGRGHLIRFTELERVVTLPRATREARLQALAATYSRWLEDLVARSPYDWFNFYDFWADDPISIGRRDMQQPAQERDAKNPES
ncbi:LpxL/LpxP family acyltransferase [Cupriavidus metallidurans]|uniref:Lipid A biosynthesis acyltransferase n=1 Tax=Cupriavidus metallidurans (strain ATCC 43123 / DSM 2839 / NBRC 102507 / CH34) TaxID=266264 RepID=Q1LF28_CUPMC|nr:acyltransferase [Cupriavidus metallidurans]ABF11248.1 lipid A biosynthesis acyltransferase [Cupriavidus metallidurans CH34]QGS33177.1 acyltransferase [Cupriavidus metallidurans]